MTEEQLSKAQFYWHARYYPCRDADTLVEPFLKLRADQTNWLRRARMALLLSTEEVARRAGIAGPTYRKAEYAEEHISIVNLRRYAEAMNCEFVYAIRPKSRQCYGEIIWQTLYKALKDRPQLQRSARPVELLQYLAGTLMRKPSFRREQGWSKGSGKRTFGVPQRFRSL